jgi:hypothetical protein
MIAQMASRLSTILLLLSAVVVCPAFCLGDLPEAPCCGDEPRPARPADPCADHPCFCSVTAPLSPASRLDPAGRQLVADPFVPVLLAALPGPAAHRHGVPSDAPGPPTGRSDPGRLPLRI